MTTQADLDAADALIIAGDFDGANAIFRGDWPNAHLAYMQLMRTQHERIVRVALAAVDSAGGLFAWENTNTVAVIASVLIDLTTQASGALTADVGPAVDATTLSDTLLDGVNLGAAAGIFNSVDHQGTNGLVFRRVPAGEFITGSTVTGASAGIVGFAHVAYRLV